MGRGAVSQRQGRAPRETSAATERSSPVSASPSLKGIMQGRKVFSLPPCCFQVTGRNVELAQPSGRTWANLWVSPHQSPATHWFPAAARALPAPRVTTRHTEGSKSGLDCVCGGLGALCSCGHQLNWGTATLELCWHPGCTPVWAAWCHGAWVPQGLGFLSMGIHGDLRHSETLQ